MNRSLPLRCLLGVIGVASSAQADITVSGAIYRGDVPGFLGIYEAGPLDSVGRGVSYERFSAAESVVGATASGGGPGYLYSRSFAEYRLNEGNPQNPGAFGLQANSVAEAMWSDLIVSGPAGPATVPFSINFFLDGYAVVGSIGPGNGTAGSTYASFVAYVQGEIVARGAYAVNSLGGLPSPGTAEGVFANFTGTAQVSTDTVMVPVNTPFSIRLQLQTIARVDVTFADSGTTTAFMNFGDTASLATNGPAFNVPDGYTVSSEAARVTDNVYSRCFCDWDHTGVVNSQDLFDFLISFFAGSADINYDGFTNSQDFFDFLACFFTACV